VLEPRIVRLARGRGLAFTELGDPSGFPVISCHGGLIGRLDVAAAHDTARRLGVWLISPDRPGVGASEPAPDRTLLDWSDDVGALADLLGIDQLSVMGWSMGGPYAAACAFGLHDRVRRAAIIAGCPPLDDPARFAELPRMDVAFTQLSRRAPALARTIFATLGRLADRAPRVWSELLARSLPQADAAVVRSMPLEFARAQAEALRTSAGMVTEYDVWARPWGFALGDIEVEVDIWQGERDTIVPPSWADILAAGIPNATRHTVPDAGHFLAHDHYEEILERLLPSA
jgi:pimeloyl-ACP methyl ester carboxylesterase